jgi:hypothetical protein
MHLRYHWPKHLDTARYSGLVALTWHSGSENKETLIRGMRAHFVLPFPLKRFWTSIIFNQSYDPVLYLSSIEYRW